ncbi:PEP-CTERM sorting domain-containing protein [Alteromonas facilis]|uniref:PEP-CTERM sorting domain-containing protein n=1 Tax=Alteromonas facilis TaxID=2048004 RepID=UPI000C28B111|nr:PEP-CTERM sorting domain-containing protein [Alteromonas facilis]
MKKIIGLALGTTALFAGNVYAGQISTPTSVNCNVENVTLTAVAESPDVVDMSTVNIADLDNLLQHQPDDVTPNDPNDDAVGYYASACAGFLGNDDQGGLSSPDPNLGEEGDGLLNGEQNKFFDSPFFAGGAFITPDDYLDLDNDGNATDPGWIHLASSASDSNPLGMSYSSVTNKGQTLNIADVLNIKFSCIAGANDSCTQGSWQLTTSTSIVEEVQAVLGRSTFDHLAISLKSATQFIVYDFNFKEIFTNEALGGNTAFNFLTPYTLGGTFNMGDFDNGNGSMQGISHINVWARDPMATVVSEPGLLALFGTAFGLIALRRRKK